MITLIKFLFIIIVLFLLSIYYFLNLRKNLRLYLNKIISLKNMDI